MSAGDYRHFAVVRCAWLAIGFPHLAQSMRSRIRRPPFKICPSFHKRCSAGPDRKWQSPDVDPNTAIRLESLRPAIKREWEKLLRTEPALSPMANPDTLVYLMDETLKQLCDGLRTRSAKGGPGRAATAAAPLQRRCPCGLNPLLNYYATGELAVHAAAATRLAGADLEETLLFFHAIAQREIDTLCSVCQHKHGAAARSEASLTGSDR
jgi:hypothetical protein